MRKNSLDTAILVFIRSATQEAAEKQLVRGSQRRQRALFQQLNAQVLKVAKSSGLPVFVAKGQAQQGSTFGERLGNAFQDLFSQGFSKVITIGNDCLGVDKARLLAAQKALETQAVVLGPAQDGGAYLIGYQQVAFNFNTFVNSAWQTNLLCQELIKNSENKGYCIHLLPQEIDLDNAALFQKIIALLKPTSPLFLRLRNYISDLFITPFSLKIPYFFTSFVAPYASRPPPNQ